jgi:hypothetical protein
MTTAPPSKSEPGETYVIEPGHQAEVFGNETFVGFEFQPQSAEASVRAAWDSARVKRFAGVGLPARWNRFEDRKLRRDGLSGSKPAEELELLVEGHRADHLDGW